jgi:spore maturation protein CgeB
MDSDCEMGMSGARPMRILFVWPVCRFSVWDVARGYRSALTRLVGDTNISDYFLDKHFAYHQKAIPEDAQNEIVLSKMASENILNEALYMFADIVIVVAGLNLHPLALWGLRRAGIAACTILTESPYEDVNQADWASVYPEMVIATTERSSLKAFPNWHYVPHAFDPAYHQPAARSPEYACDVLMVGTGWPERQRLLEKVDWAGIDLKLFGIWGGITPSSPLHKFYPGGTLIDNRLITQRYCSAKVCLNIHRPHATAESLGPRAYELAACGAFQICDRRPEVTEVFGDAVPTVDVSSRDAHIHLEHHIRWALEHPDERLMMALRAKDRVQSHTFDNRARRLLEAVAPAIGSAVPHPQQSDSIDPVSRMLTVPAEFRKMGTDDGIEEWNLAKMEEVKGGATQQA